MSYELNTILSASLMFIILYIVVILLSYMKKCNDYHKQIKRIANSEYYCTNCKLESLILTEKNTEVIYCPICGR